jgi:hypothetical protein
MTNKRTPRVLKSAARWLQRRARSKSSPDTKAAYREAIQIVNRLCIRPRGK